MAMTKEFIENNLKNKSPEERREIARKGAEARARKKNERMALQKCMRTLLKLNVTNEKQKQLLRQIGIEDSDLTNQTLLMVALFKKGTMGDVSAIKEIVEMIDKLDMLEHTGKVTSNITINLVSKGDVYKPNEKDEQDIWDAENESEWLDEEDNDEWGNDVYYG